MSNPGESPNTLPPLSQSPSPAYPFAPTGTLAYVSPDLDANRRPGLVLALGITSIVIGTLSGLVALFSTLQAVMFFFMARLSTMLPTVPSSGSGTTSSTSAPVNPAAVFSGLTNGSVAPRIIYVVAAIAAVGAAILLLIAGIQTVRGVRSGRWLHVVWLPLKVCVATVLSISYALVMSQFMTGAIAAQPAGSASAASPVNTMYATVAMAVIEWFWSLLYPAAVGIVIFLPNVRRYFATR